MVYALLIGCVCWLIYSWVRARQLRETRRQQEKMLVIEKARAKAEIEAEEARLAGLFLVALSARDKLTGYRCEITLSGAVRWQCEEWIRLEDENLASGSHRVGAKHSSPFVIHGTFNLGSDDHLRCLIKNLIQMKAQKKCELIQILESRSVQRSEVIENYCDAYDFSGVPWFDYGEELYMEQHAHSIGAYTSYRRTVTYTFLDDENVGMEFIDTDGKWRVETRYGDQGYDPYETDIYDGVDLADSCAIVLYCELNGHESRRQFSVDQADSVLEFLLTGVRQQDATSD